jgi:tetratricopeptide (TPR) repeat protein
MLKGRMLLAAGRADEAAIQFREAAKLGRLPEIQWALADALRAAGRELEAKAAEAELESKGAFEDPRSFSLYLATRGVDAARAVELARKELSTRQDIFTKDALAWALHADGKNDEAVALMEEALAPGTLDARLFCHAAVIFGAAGRMDEANRASAEAARLKHLLLPSETQHTPQAGG